MIYVYDEELNKIGIIDRYNSLITAKRYKENGDCEIYLPASKDVLDLLKIGRFVGKTDDSVVYRINYIELNTDAENGNFLTVKGIDSKSFIDQRIVMNTSICNGNAEQFALQLVRDSLAGTAAANRKLKNSQGELLFNPEETGLTETLTEQVSYKNVGEKIREYCGRFGWGYKAELRNRWLYFSVYKGTDRSSTVVFSPQYENISTSDYSHDRTEMENVALVAGEGQGADRYRELVGSATGADRYEIFVDAKELSRRVTYSEMTAAYPNGTIRTDVQGYMFYNVDGVDIAMVFSLTPAADETVELTDSVYASQLAAKGTEELAQYPEVTSFQSEIIPDVTWVYGRDYYLGDIVKVENEYGITANARIAEVIEVEDESGYSIQPTFEYLGGD